MKRYSILVLAIVLTVSLLTGCGCTGKNTPNTSAPTVLPTNEEVRPTTEPTRATTEATTAPTTMATEPSETIDRGNGALEDTTSAADSTTESMARGILPNMN